MVNREIIVETARAFKGTPFAHQGRRPGVALDCAGVIICDANEVGLAVDFDFLGYGRYPKPSLVRAQLVKNLDFIAGGIAAAQTGDVAWIADHGYATHLAILAERDGYLTMIHSSQRDGGVIEERVGADEAYEVRGVFRFRGID